MHSKIITAVAGQVLKPMGVRQKGRSRSWFDDRGWYATAIEFQPSGWSKGTYLNVGVHWLWYPQDHWTFDLGHRKHEFVAFRSAAQFEPAVRAIAQLAASEVVESRTGLGSLSEARAWVRQRSNMDDEWQCLHCGIVAALAGATCEAREAIEAAFDPAPAFDWIQERNAYIKELQRRIDDSQVLRAWIEGKIRECRASLRLPDSPEPRLPPR
jgi:hypothetical protein